MANHDNTTNDELNEVDNIITYFDPETSALATKY